MDNIRLTLSCGDYDRTRPLIDGMVATPGLDLAVIPLPSAERHTRFVTNFEFDVCELQIAQYLGLKSRGVPITAVPVFPHRRFNHSCLMVRLDSDIVRPRRSARTPRWHPRAFQSHRALDPGCAAARVRRAAKLDPLGGGRGRACAGLVAAFLAAHRARAGRSKDAKFTGDRRVGCANSVG